MRSFNEVIELNRPDDMSINLKKYLSLEREILNDFWVYKQDMLKKSNQALDEDSKESDYKKNQNEIEQNDEYILLNETNAWSTQLLEDNNDKHLRRMLEFARLQELISPNELYGIEDDTAENQTEFKLIDKVINKIGTIHEANLFFAAAKSAFDFAITMGTHASQNVIDFFNLFQYAMQATMITLTVTGVLDAAKAYFDKKTEGRNIIMLEGINRSILGSLALTMSFKLIQTASYAIPLLFYGIVAGFAIKDHLLLQQTTEKRIALEKQLNTDIRDLQSRLNELENNSDKAANDPKVIRLALQIDETKKNIEVLKARENSLKLSRNTFSTVGVICATLFFIASFSNPLSATAVGLVAASLVLFFVMGKIIELIKQNEMEKIKKIHAKKINTNAVIQSAINNNTLNPDMDKSSNKHTVRTDINSLRNAPLPKVMQKGGFLFFKKKDYRISADPSAQTPLLRPVTMNA